MINRIGTGLLLTIAVGCAAMQTVEWRNAPGCVGRACAVRGTVASQEDEGGVIRLYFDRERRDISVLLVRSVFVTWPSYVGREVVAKGKVRRFRDQVEVVASQPRDIETADAGISSPTVAIPPTAPPATEVRVTPSVPTPTPNASEVERLRGEVQRLEERVRELEKERKR